MKTRINLKNGSKMSILGFGCMRLPTKNGNIDEQRSIELIRSAARAGVNYFDTAYIYHRGKSEVLLGKALAGDLRTQVSIATKLPPFMVSKLDSAKKILATQLQRLQTDYIDYYLLHMLVDQAMFERLKDLGVMAWLEDLKAKGVIRNIGFSFHGAKRDFESLIQAYPWDFCQIQYNYVDENNQATKSGLQLAYDLGIPVIVMEPLRGGKLVNPMEIFDLIVLGGGPAGYLASERAGHAGLSVLCIEERSVGGVCHLRSAAFAGGVGLAMGLEPSPGHCGSLRHE